MHIHFIAIGGAIMHQIAIAMKRKGHRVTGSDDVIQEPSKSQLEAEGILPTQLGFHAENITRELELVLLGMHAKFDNPELTRAMELGIKVLSFPEFIYENSKEKTRVVIAGSHGKTSITSMVMHCLKENNVDFDYMVGSSVAGFEHSVRLSDAPIIIIEGDEYLASPINKEPKFIYYHAHFAVLTGIEWDHINVFKTEEIYFEQFRKLVRSMESNSTLYYCNQEKIQNTISEVRTDIQLIPYDAIPYSVDNERFFAEYDGQKIPLELFGKHNMENIEAARNICHSLGLTDEKFYESISHFSGAGRRLELILDTEERVIYKDFAHSPSKLRATIQAVKEKYPSRLIVACFEMHTFSTLSSEFLPQYHHSMDDADIAIIFIDKEVVIKKGNTIFSEQLLQLNFHREDIKLFTNKIELEDYLRLFLKDKPVYLMMTSGTFSGMDLKSIGGEKEALKIQSIISGDNIENTAGDNVFSASLYESKFLSTEEFNDLRIMFSVSFLGFIFIPLYFYFKYKNTTSYSFYNIISIYLNFQILATLIFIIGLVLSYKFSLLFFAGVIFNCHYTNRAIQQLSRRMPIDIPNGVLVIFPKIDKT